VSADSTADVRTPVDHAGGQQSEDASGDTLPAARVPRSAARAGWLGVLLAVAVLGLGVLAAYDATTLLGWVDAEPVGTPVLDTDLGVRPDTATTVLAVALVLLGLWLTWSALQRSARRGARLATSTGVWITYGDLERLVNGTAEDVDGVVSAHTAVSRRRARVSVQMTAPEVREYVQVAVTERLSALQSPPRVTVIGNPGHDDGGEAR